MAADPLLPVADALARILAAVPLMPGEEAPVSGALGRVTAEPVRARRTQPPVAMSAMDGYAVRAEDVGSVPATLTRVGDAPAGGSYPGTVTAGQAVRIFTGGPGPDGADTIVIQEDVDAESETDGARITVREGAPAGKFIRPAGLDFKSGDVGIEAGRAMTARDVGLAAVVVGHHPPAGFEHVADRLDDFLVAHQLHAHDMGDHLARDVVLGRPQPAATDHRVGAIEAKTDRRLHTLEIVADLDLEVRVYAGKRQLLADPGRIGIDNLAQ